MEENEGRGSELEGRGSSRLQVFINSQQNMITPGKSLISNEMERKEICAKRGRGRGRERERERE